MGERQEKGRSLSHLDFHCGYALELGESLRVKGCPESKAHTDFPTPLCTTFCSICQLLVVFFRCHIMAPNVKTHQFGVGAGLEV